MIFPADEGLDPDAEALKALAFQLDRVPPDPANSAPYPRGLSLDLALETASLKEILDSYELTPNDARLIFANAAFKREYDEYKELMRTQGWSFKTKCAAQAEAYLGLMWRLANSEHTPAPVRADLIKNTIKWAGLDTPAQAPAGMSLPERMMEQLQSMPDSEIEMRVMQIIQRKTPVTKQTEKLVEDNKDE